MDATNAKPPLLFKPEDIPGELKRDDQRFIVTWCAEINPQTGKISKTPGHRNDHGRIIPVSVAKPNNLMTFNKAIAIFNAGRADGIGLALHPATGTPYGAIDIDDPSDSFAQETIAEALRRGCYVQRSPSGRGLHIIGQGLNKATASGKQPIDLPGTFITLTGVMAKNDYRWLDGAAGLGDPNTGIQDMLDGVYSHYHSGASTTGDNTGDVLNIPPRPDFADVRSKLRPEMQEQMEHGYHELSGDASAVAREAAKRLRKEGLEAPEIACVLSEPGLAVSEKALRNRNDNVDSAYQWAYKYQALKAISDKVSAVDVFEEFNDPDQTDNIQALLDRLITLDDADSEDLPEAVVDKIAPAGEVTLLAGHGGAGKSYVALLIAVLVVLGRDFGGLKTKFCRVLFVSAEDGEAIVKYRVRQICRALGAKMSELNGRLHILDVSEMEACLFTEKSTPLLGKLGILAQRLGIGMVIIDNASDTFGGDEIRRAQVRAFVRSLRTHLARPDRALILLAHVNKIAASQGRNASAEDYSGSTAWHNSCRSRLTLSSDKDGYMELQHQKANHGPKADTIRLTWIDGVPMTNGIAGVFGDFDPERQRLFEEQERMKDEVDRRAVLAVIREFYKRGERVTTAMQGSATIHHLLKDCEGIPKGITSGRLNKLVRSLESGGLIIRKETPDKYRKPREGFIPAPIPAGDNSPGVLNVTVGVAA